MKVATLVTQTSLPARALKRLFKCCLEVLGFQTARQLLLCSHARALENDKNCSPASR